LHSEHINTHRQHRDEPATQDLEPDIRLKKSRKLRAVGRSLAVASHAIGVADPKHGIHSPGFRSYEDDGG